MSLWESRAFPWICDQVLGTPEVTALRTELLARAQGTVLELGFGSGLNLPCYPASVSRLIAIDPSAGMHRRAQPRLAAARFPVEVLDAAGETLHLPDAHVDTAVSTFTLCSVTSPSRALSELRRVLRPGGLLLIAEHGLSPRPFMSRVQRALTPLNRVVACGCHLDRPMRALVESAGFRWSHVADARHQALAGPFSWLTVGVAS